MTPEPVPVAPYEPRPGDIYLTEFAGPLGPFIELAQAVAALSPSMYSHAGVVGRNGDAIEAQGRGVTRTSMDRVWQRKRLAFLAVPPDAEDRRDAIVDAAEALIDTPYGFAAYPYIGLLRLGIRNRWLEHQLEHTLICSAHADRAWDDAGVHLFTDGRVRGAVTPGHLAHRGVIHHARTGPWLSSTAPAVGITDDITETVP